MEDLWKEISIVVWFHTTEDTVYCCCSPYGRPMEGNQYSSLISYHWGYSILLLFAPMEDLWKEISIVVWFHTPLRIQYTVVVHLWKEISIVVWFHTTEDTVYCCCSPMEDLWKEISIVVWFHTTEDTVYCCCSPMEDLCKEISIVVLISYHWGYHILLLFRPMEDLCKEIGPVVWFHTTEDTVYCCCSHYGRKSV